MRGLRSVAGAASAALALAFASLGAAAAAATHHAPEARASAARWVIVSHSKYCHVTINARTGKLTFHAAAGHYGRFTVVVRHGHRRYTRHFTVHRPAHHRSGGYTRPPSGPNIQWFWELSPSNPGLAGLPATQAAYPAPGSADIWDTDLVQDSNVSGGGIPTGPSPVVQAIHAAGHYSICYVEAGAYQLGFPDDRDFATADYGGVGDRATQMQGYASEYWFDLTGFAHYVAGQPDTLTGAAVNIAAGLDKRFSWCKLEGQDAVEPDDLDGYTNRSTGGQRPWDLTQSDSAGFERWLAYDVHHHGLAIFQKNDGANAPADEPLYDGMIIEECNHYDDPCAGAGGDATAYLNAGKPVLNAEYTDDGETTAKFCSADEQVGITGALFDVDLDGRLYQPCRP